jgi:DNA-binding NarL/FixJ family response regulator
MVHILVIDDHALVRRGIIRVLENAPELQARCDEAAGVQEATRLTAARRYHLALLDISLPGVSGLELLKALHRDHPKLPILLLTMHPEHQFAIRALSMGASGYLTKESAAEDLVTAVRRVLSGGRYVSPALAERLASHLSAANQGLQPSHHALTDREFAVLRLIGAGRKPAQIAGELFLSVKTINTYRSRILRKLDLSSSAQLMSYALRHNLVAD